MQLERFTGGKVTKIQPQADRKDQAMNVFEFRNRLIDDFSSYVRGFITVQEPRLSEHVMGGLSEGVFWPEPLIQLNPSFEAGSRIDDLVETRVLREECSRIFRKDKTSAGNPGTTLRLPKHQ